ncbi:MAG: hypothetical protein H6741_32920 [Alphaproteobacteria bacterium]|nr:hypothetical protein [Alphaproteobacteria bacterium]MCB9797519.1 hypothetical protein [Alphaproteobacteria bacterium]
MRRILFAAAALLALSACDPAINPSGTITVKNEDGQKWQLLITTEEACTLGLHTSINPNTQTTFDVDLTTKNYVCVNEQGPPIEIENNGNYIIEGGRWAKR